MKCILRRATMFALVLVVSVFSVAPHQHEGLLDELTQRDPVRIGTCDTPYQRHFHAARFDPPHPCAACARNHTNGALHIVAQPLARSAVTVLLIAVASQPRQSTFVFQLLRGPPTQRLSA